jgi:hypothetical protein
METSMPSGYIPSVLLRYLKTRCQILSKNVTTTVVNTTVPNNQQGDFKFQQRKWTS